MESRQHTFRDYENTADQVKLTYQAMQEKQTVEYVRLMKERYTTPLGTKDPDGHGIRKRLLDVFTLLDSVIDESDPDTDLPQIVHAFQTGESLRETFKPDLLVKSLFTEEEWGKLPLRYQQKYSTTLAGLYSHIEDWSWLPLIGFIHDLGKVLATPEWGKLPQWSVVGDTFPVGAPFSMSNVYASFGFFAKNPSLNGESRYQHHCGFNNIDMSFGHDEYCYAVLNRAIHHLPKEALYIIRYHSFYAWHSPRNGQRGYTEFANDEDWLMLPLLKLFQKSDLYSKSTHIPDLPQLKEYYTALIEKFIPGREKSEKIHHKSAKLVW